VSDREHRVNSGLEARYRYRAFISYSHRDKAVVQWLHRVLEGFRIPSKLVGTSTPVGTVPRRLTPIFRDRDELPASSDLGTVINAALADTMFIIVICSPASAKSPWVEAEIVNFKRMHGEARVLALIASGVPYGSMSPETADQECFPRALRYKVIDGQISDEPAEPIAADLRKDTDGKRLATLKLVAGLTGVTLDAIVQREQQRRMRRLAMLSTASVIGMIITGGLAVYANQRRIEANEQRLIAERESATARTTSDFLIGTFVLSDPQSENPKTITAQTILSRGAERARKELATQPVVQARLIATLGQAYNNLGLFDDARNTIDKAMPAVRKAGIEGVNAWLTLATTEMLVGHLDQSRKALATAQQIMGPDLTQNADKRGRAARIEGMIDTAAGQTKDGIAAFNRALDFYRNSSETDRKQVGYAMNNLGLLLSDDSQFDLAQRTLQGALGIFRRELGEVHLVTGQTWYALGQNAFLAAMAPNATDVAGKLSEAERDVDKALTIERRVLDPDNRIIADALSLQGQIYQAQKRLDKAEQSLKQAVEIYRVAFKGPHYLIGIAEVYLALIQSDRGNTAAALRTLDDAKANYDASYGKLHPNHGDLLVQRATILAKAGRKAEARQDCAAGLDILSRTLGKDANYTKQMAATCKSLTGGA
jgi:tetratricopeptide (TPR) repeat protein